MLTAMVAPAAAVRRDHLMAVQMVVQQELADRVMPGAAVAVDLAEPAQVSG